MLVLRVAALRCCRCVVAGVRLPVTIPTGMRGLTGSSEQLGGRQLDSMMTTMTQRTGLQQQQPQQHSPQLPRGMRGLLLQLLLLLQQPQRRLDLMLLLPCRRQQRRLQQQQG